MKLLLIRHAIAEDAETFIAAGGTDAQRPLTEIGRKKMRKGANRLRSQVRRIDLLAHSPLLRARETAELIARAFGDRRSWNALNWTTAIRPKPFADWLAQGPPEDLVAAVGHEPQLACCQVCSWLMRRVR